jgi:hypothetical protein
MLVDKEWLITSRRECVSLNRVVASENVAAAAADRWRGDILVVDIGRGRWVDTVGTGTVGALPSFEANTAHLE